MYYGQYGIDKVIEDNYLDDFDPNGWLVECGAGDGISDSVCLHFEQEYGFRVINIEANQNLLGALSENRPKSINLYGALGSSDKTVEFIKAEKSGEISGGSVSYKKDYDKYLQSIGYTLSKQITSGYTFDTLVGEVVKGCIELFVLDVEGYELEVLSGMNIFLPKVICVEYTLSGLDEIKGILIPKGYRFDFVSENNALFSLGLPERTWIGSTKLWQS